MERQAKYKIRTHTSTVIIKADTLSFKKCMQIMRLHEGGKAWKGYELNNIEYDLNGLVKLDISKAVNYPHPTIFQIS